MKRGFKLFSVVCLVLASIFVLAACGGPKAKTFERDGIKITTTTDFSMMELEGYSLYLYSSDVYVYGVRMEDSNDFSIENTLDQFTGAINLTLPGLTFNSHDHDGAVFNYFSYEYDTLLGRYKYLNITKKGEAAFYMIEFAVRVDKYDSYADRLMQWTKTIEVA